MSLSVSNPLARPPPINPASSLRKQRSPHSNTMSAASFTAALEKQAFYFRAATRRKEVDMDILNAQLHMYCAVIYSIFY